MVWDIYQGSDFLWQNLRYAMPSKNVSKSTMCRSSWRNWQVDIHLKQNTKVETGCQFSGRGVLQTHFESWGVWIHAHIFLKKKRLPGKLRQDVVEWDDESFCSGQRAKSTKSFNKIQRVLLFFCCFWTLNLCFSNDFRRNFYLAGSSQVGPWLHLFVQGWWGWEWAKGLGKKCYVFFDISGVISWCLGFFTRKIGEMIQFDEHGFSKMGASTTKCLLFFWGGGVRVENGLRLIFWST